MTLFSRYIGIDYSGAKTPTSSLDGLRIYMATKKSPPVEVLPPPGSKKHWTRRGVAEWLVDRLREDPRTLVGIDHAFSFPLAYFERHGLPRRWPGFLEDFRKHWPTDEDDTSVQLVRDGIAGDGELRSGDPKWKRLAEVRARTAKSVFFFDVEGSVAKSTHAGLPWLLHLRHELRGRIHFWPLDGWEIPAERSVVTEVYPAIFSPAFAPEDRTPDQHDAYAVAAWMRRADADGRLDGYFAPSLDPAEKRTAAIEGWILGVM